jgi:predicted Zn finger-like uncharacterized protein
MILTCPSCATRYQADAAMIAPPGRNVRCAKCSHVWFQASPEPEVEPEPEPVPQPAEVHIPEPPPRAMASAVTVEDTPTDEAPPRPAMPRVNGRHLAALGGWAALIVVVVGLAFAGVQYRQAVASLWPKTASLYAALGAPVNVRGLDLRDVHPDRQIENGQPVLEVKGDIVNVSDHPIPVPQIRVALIDDDAREVYHWTFDSGAGTLASGASHAFTTRLTAPPQEAKSLDIRFAETGEQ